MESKTPIAILEREKRAVPEARPAPARASNLERDRLKVLDLVRSGSMMSVVASHLYFVAHHQLGTPSTDIVLRLSAQGYAIPSFFFASGFLITRVTARRFGDLFNVRPHEFYVLRAARILPLLLLVMATGALLSALNTNQSELFRFCFNANGPMDWYFWASLLAFCYNWLIVKGLGAHGLYWGVLWSLSVEEQFYVVYPWLLRSVKTLSNLFVVGLTLVAIGPLARYLGQIWLSNQWMEALHTSFACFDSIAMGCLLYLVTQKWPKMFEGRERLASLLTICGALSIALVVWRFKLTYPGLGQIWGPSLMNIALSMFVLGALNVKLMQRLPAAMLLPGKLCYGIYVWHVVAIYLASFVWKGVDLWIMYLLCLGSLLAFSKICFEWFEQPASRIVKRWFGF